MTISSRCWLVTRDEAINRIHRSQICNDANSFFIQSETLSCFRQHSVTQHFQMLIGISEHQLKHDSSWYEWINKKQILKQQQCLFSCCFDCKLVNIEWNMKRPLLLLLERSGRWSSLHSSLHILEDISGVCMWSQQGLGANIPPVFKVGPFFTTGCQKAKKKQLVTSLAQALN